MILAASGGVGDLRDGRSQRGLPVVDMADGPHVQMRLVPLELPSGEGAGQAALEASVGREVEASG